METNKWPRVPNAQKT
jgi:hypothetical protein